MNDPVRSPNSLPVMSAALYKDFHNWRVVHPKLSETREALWQAIHYAGDRRVIHVVGCTGVGKTTLRLWLERLLMEEAREAVAQDLDFIPVASVVTPSPDQGPFSWRDVYIQTMHALGEPASLISRKQSNRLQFMTADKLAMAPTLPRQQLRLAMTGCLYMRRVQVLFYDDAQHFQMVTKAQRLQDQMDNLKWLSDVTGTCIVLVGTYDLLNLLDLNGQLARRSATLHFARYHAAEKEEFQQFASVVYAFQQHLPLADDSALVDHCDYLYEHSLGCVGLLKDWLEQALGQALEQGDKKLTEKRLELCIDKRKLVAIAKEAVTGEQRFYGTDGLEAEWQGLLKSATRIPTAVRPPDHPVSTRPGTRHPGQRTAKRDLVGIGELSHG